MCTKDGGKGIEFELLHVLYISIKYEQKLGLLIAAPMLVELMLLGTV